MWCCSRPKNGYDTDSDEADACDDRKILLADIIRNKATSEDADCRRNDEGQSGTCENRQFAYAFVRGEEHRGQLRFVAQLRNKDGRKYDSKGF